MYVESLFSVLCVIYLVSFSISFSSDEYFNVTNRFCFLGGRYYLLSFNSSFFMSVCCFFILYFISHSAFWKHRISSFWLIFLSFCNASVSCMIYAIQTHKQQGKLCLAAFGCLCSYVQHLVDVSWPDLFSSGAAKGGVGVASCSSGLPSRWAFCFGAVFCIHLSAGSFHISYVACLCLLICNVTIHTQVEISPSPPSLGELSLHSWLSLMFSIYKVLALSSHLFWMLLIPGAKGLSQLGAAAFLRASLVSELCPPIRSFWKDHFIVFRLSSICFYATFLRGLYISFLLLPQTSYHKLSDSYNTNTLVLEVTTLTYLFLGYHWALAGLHLFL